MKEIKEILKELNENPESEKIKKFIKICLNETNLVKLEIADFKCILNLGKPSFIKPDNVKGAIIFFEADNLDIIEKLSSDIIKNFPDDANVVWGAVSNSKNKSTVLYVS